MADKRWQKVVTTRPSKIIPQDDTEMNLPRKCRASGICLLPFLGKEREMRHARIL
jgi:hypothetical protein